MSLFVGNISRDVRYEDIRDLFESKGSCSINLKNSYAFIDFDNEAHGEKAKTDLHNKEI